MLQLTYIYNHFSKLDINLKPLQLMKPDSIHFPISNNYIPRTIYNKMTSLNNSIHFNFTSNSITFNVYVYYIKNYNIKHILENIYITLSFLSNFSINPSNNEVTLYYYLLNHKKVYKKPLSSLEVNSGMYFSNKRTIYIWRLEEIIKVTIHEILHFLDKNLYKKDLLLSHYNQKYNLKNENININEAYIDFWAIIINSYINSITTSNTLESFTKNIKEEIKFIRYQCNKVLHMNVMNLNKYTHVFSYYILKYELFNNIDILLKYCITNNINLIHITNLDTYINLITRFKKIKKYKLSIKNKFYRTMRMSIIDVV